MKNQNFEIIKDKCFNYGHYKTFESFCFECKMNLCEECLKDFNNFRYNHKNYEINFIEETNE